MQKKWWQSDLITSVIDVLVTDHAIDDSAGSCLSRGNDREAPAVSWGLFLCSGSGFGSDLFGESVQENGVPRNLECPKCRRQMIEGVILDRTYGQVAASSWIAGPVEKGWLGSIKLRGKTLVDITTYRCPSCGYLESYAPQQ
jgi:predicted RNA-binding Zn-ribbon protein involved in translation (DUF1610 family)